MQTTTDRPTPARGIVVALYHGKAVAWCHDSVVASAERRTGREPARGPGIPRAGEGS